MIHVTGFDPTLGATAIQKVNDQTASTGPWIAFIGTVVTALTAGIFGFYQWRKSNKLEAEKLEWEREKLFRTWSREEALEQRALQEEERGLQSAKEVEAEKKRAQREAATASLTQYCSRLSHELRLIKILDMSRPIDLLKLYVTLQISEHTQQYASDDGVISDTSSHFADDDQSVAINRAISSSTYTPEEAFRHYRKLVVLGDPGAGKTTMLRKLALEMAEGRYQTVEGGPQVPLYLELRTLLEAETDSIVDILATEWSRQFRLNIPQQELIARLDSGEAVFLLDGLDEVLGGIDIEKAEKAYARSISMIERIVRSYPKCPIVVTCRRHGWRGGLPAFQTVEVLDFNWDQIERFIEAWFDRDPAKGRRLVRTLSVNMRLKNLATNPLLLSLIAIVFERDLELPERRAALYRRCVEVLLREWDSHRQIRRISRFTTDRKLDLLREIAWHFHLQGRRYFSHDDICELIARYLPTIDIDKTDTEAILHEIESQYGLLKTQAQGWHGFIHLTIQEYFVAESLLQKGSSGIEFLTARSVDPWWEEVILLYTGATHDATQLLAGLVSAEALAANDSDAGDLFHSQLFLAGRCLASAPRVSDRQIRDRILDLLIDLWLRSAFKYDQDRASRVLLEVSASSAKLRDRLLELLAPNEVFGIQPTLSLLQSIRSLGAEDYGRATVGLLSTGRVHDKELTRSLIETVADLNAAYALPQLKRLYAENTSDELKVSYAVAIARLSNDPEPVLQLFSPSAPRIRSYSSLNSRRLPNPTGARLKQLHDSILLDTGSEYFFERGQLLQWYALNSTADGILTLLAEVFSTNRADHLRVSVAFSLPEALGDLVANPSSPDQILEYFVNIAEDRSLSWQVRWCISECLDLFDSPRDIVVAQLLRKSSDKWDLGDIGLAITLIKWRELRVLSDVVQKFQSELIPASLRFDEKSRGWVSTNRIWDRLLPTLLEFDRPGTKEFLVNLASAQPNTHSKRRGEKPTAIDALNALSKIDAVRAFDIAFGEETGVLRGRRLPGGIFGLRIQVPPNRVDQMCKYIAEFMPKAVDNQSMTVEYNRRWYFEQIVNAVESDRDIAAMMSLWADPRQQDNPLYEALHKASRKCRFTITRDGIVPWLTP